MKAMKPYDARDYDRGTILVRGTRSYAVIGAYPGGVDYLRIRGTDDRPEALWSTKAFATGRRIVAEFEVDPSRRARFAYKTGGGPITSIRRKETR